MASPVDICNRALRRLGTSSITAFDGSTQTVRDCELYYDISRQTTLRAHPWNFAQRRLRLSGIDVPDGYGQYQYAYLYPYDCLDLVSIKSNGTGDSCDYELGSLFNDSRIIMTNCQYAVAFYTADVQNSEMFDPLFQEVLSYQLAANLAEPVTQSTNKSKEMTNLYVTALVKARVADGRENKPEQTEEDGWLYARKNSTAVYKS